MRRWKKLPPPPTPKVSEKVRDVRYEQFGDDESLDRLSRDTFSAVAVNPPKVLHRITVTYEDGRTVKWQWVGVGPTVEYDR